MDQSIIASVSHTAGPWHAEAAPSASSMRSIRTASGKAIAFVNRGPDAAANERLITAAPELLDFVRSIASWFEAVEIDDLTEEARYFYREARRLVGQAEGRQP